MRQQGVLLAHLVTAGYLVQFNESFLYQRPRIRGLQRAPLLLQFKNKNVFLHVTPTDSDSSSTEVSSEEAYADQMTIEPITPEEADELFLASVVQETSDLLETSAMDVPPMPNQTYNKVDKELSILTRRAWLQTGIVVGAGIFIAAATIMNERAMGSKRPAKTFKPLVSPLAIGNSMATKTGAPTPKQPSTQPAMASKRAFAPTIATPNRNPAKSGTNVNQSKKSPARATAPKTVNPNANPAKPAANANNPATKVIETAKNESIKKLEPINITQVAAETNVNITLNCQDACVSIDPVTMTKVKSKKVPYWVPSWLVPRPTVIKQFSNAELLVAATFAGSIVDVGRTSLLYPIQTVKTRIQTDIKNETRPFEPIKDRIMYFSSTVKQHIDEGDLYAGIKPTLLVSVPATGIYYGVRDVSKHVLAMTPLTGIQIALLAALIGDIVSLCFRAPADTLRVRLQNLDNDVGDWFGDSLKKLPQIIATDLPYLLSKISLNRLLIHGNISIDQYTEYAIISSSIAALLTTPFDVARTRILVDSDGDCLNGLDSGRGGGVLATMKCIVKEGNGGYGNLFAGWFERVLYLGVGRAWFEPIQLIGYIGIRDAVLLEWF